MHLEHMVSAPASFGMRQAFTPFMPGLPPSRKGPLARARRLVGTGPSRPTETPWGGGLQPRAESHTRGLTLFLQSPCPVWWRREDANKCEPSHTCGDWKQAGRASQRRWHCHWALKRMYEFC